MSDTVGSRIRGMRLERGLTIRRLAALALGGEKNAAQISRWENGRNAPGLESLSRLAAALGCHVAELIPDSSRNMEAA